MVEKVEKHKDESENESEKDISQVHIDLKKFSQLQDIPFKNFELHFGSLISAAQNEEKEKKERENETQLQNHLIHITKKKESKHHKKVKAE
jgi:hypothetical protein